MSLSDDEILIFKSRNMDDDLDGIPGDEKIQGGSDKVFANTLETQGIFFEKEDERVFSIKPRDDFSDELFQNGGIEIISSGAEIE